MSEWISPEWVADKLSFVKPNGAGFIGSCPAHEDDSPSFRVSTGNKGTIMYCHAGCTIEDLCTALEISREQLFYDYRSTAPDETYAALQALVRKHTPVNIWEPETLGDVMELALETEVLTQDEWIVMRTCASMNWKYWSMPYPEAMRYWSGAISNGVLFDFLNQWWHRSGQPDWEWVKHHAHRKMNEVWRTREKQRQGSRSMS